MNAPSKGQGGPEPMPDASAEAAAWAERLRALPTSVRAVVESLDERTLRARPAAGEWSAIEVLGHLIDKLQVWRTRLERIVAEDRPVLMGYDQDAAVREHAYQTGDRRVLLTSLDEAAERFASTAAGLTDADLARPGDHSDMGPITARDCLSLPVESAVAHLDQMRAAVAAAAGARPSS